MRGARLEEKQDGLGDDVWDSVREDGVTRSMESSTGASTDAPGWKVSIRYLGRSDDLGTGVSCGVHGCLLLW